MILTRSQLEEFINNMVGWRDLGGNETELAQRPICEAQRGFLVGILGLSDFPASGYSFTRDARAARALAALFDHAAKSLTIAADRIEGKEP